MGKDKPDWMGDEKEIPNELSEEEEKEFREIELGYQEDIKKNFNKKFKKNKYHKILIESIPQALEDNKETFRLTPSKYKVNEKVTRIKINPHKIIFHLIAQIYSKDYIRAFEIFEPKKNKPKKSSELITLYHDIDDRPSTIIIEDGRVYHDLKLRNLKEYSYEGHRLNAFLEKIIRIGGLEKLFKEYWED